jgi:hypothetical protein
MVWGGATYFLPGEKKIVGEILRRRKEFEVFWEWERDLCPHELCRRREEGEEGRGRFQSIKSGRVGLGGRRNHEEGGV